MARCTQYTPATAARANACQRLVRQGWQPMPRTPYVYTHPTKGTVYVGMGGALYPV